jgi:hypothetical protein
VLATACGPEITERQLLPSSPALLMAQGDLETRQGASQWAVRGSLAIFLICLVSVPNGLPTYWVSEI